MTNRPYFSEGVNVFNEVQYTNVPATYGSNVVTVSQAQGRSIYNTDNTAIYGREPTPIIPGQQYTGFQPKSILKTRSTSPYSGTSNPNYVYPSNPFNGAPQNISSPYNYIPNQMLVPEKQMIPGGVTYTFNPAAQQYALRNFSDAGHNMWSCGNCGNCVDVSSNTAPFYQPLPNIKQPHYNQSELLSLQQQIAMKNFQQHNLEMMLMQEYMKNNPFQLKFHRDGQTDTVDLLGGNCQTICSNATPDFSNIPGVMAQTYNGDLKTLEKLDKSCGYYGHISKYKHLNLQKSPDLRRKPEDMRVNYSNTHDNRKVGPDTCDRKVFEDKNVGPEFANQNLQTCECPKYIGKQTGPDYQDKMNYFSQNVSVMEKNESTDRKGADNFSVCSVSSRSSKHHSERKKSTEDEIVCTNSSCTFPQNNRQLFLIGTPCPGSTTTVEARNQNLYLLGKESESRSNENIFTGESESETNVVEDNLFLLGSKNSEETPVNECIYAPGKDDLSVIAMVLADEKEKKRLEEELYKETLKPSFLLDMKNPSTSKENNAYCKTASCSCINKKPEIFSKKNDHLKVPKPFKKYGRKMKKYLKTKVKNHMDRIAEEYSDVGYSSSDSNNSEH